MFLKVTSATTGDEMYVNIDTVKSLIPVEGGIQTLLIFVDGDKLLVEEPIEDLLEDEDDD